MNSGDLIDKYGSKQSTKVANQFSLTLSRGDALVATNSNPHKRKAHYSQNSFKEYMGYVEPDYLRVAGLYASVETCKLSKAYGNFLVKRADYVAEALDWRTEDGKLDIKRAETAIRTACRTKAPNGLFYMYSKSNKDHCLSVKGGSRIYMSGRRYQELQDELLYLKNKNSRNADCKVSEVVSPQITSDYQRIEYMLKEVANRYEVLNFEDGAIDWMADRFIQEMSMEQFEYYCNLITSDWYYDQIDMDRYCPRFISIFDFYNKYKKVLTYADKYL